MIKIDWNSDLSKVEEFALCWLTLLTKTGTEVDIGFYNDTKNTWHYGNDSDHGKLITDKVVAWAEYEEFYPEPFNP